MFEFEAKRELLEYFLRGYENEIKEKIADLENNVDYPSYHNIDSGRYMPGMASVEEQVIMRIERREKLEQALKRVQEKSSNVETALQSLTATERHLIQAVFVYREVLTHSEYQTFINSLDLLITLMNQSESKRRERISATIEYKRLNSLNLEKSIRAQKLKSVINELAV